MSSRFEAINSIERLGQPSLVLDSDDLKHVAKLVEVAKRLLFLEAEAFVRERRHATLAEVLSQDVTPAKTATVHVQGSGDLRVQRKGRKCREWLVQRLFLLEHGPKKLVLFTDPLDMDVKTAAAHHEAGTALWGGCRLLGHEGFLITHSCFDRAIAGACARLQRQRCSALQLHLQNTVGEDAAYERYLKHFVTSVGCSAHDFTNALRWANLKEFGDRQSMKAMWISIESLRSALDQLVRVVPLWLPTVLVYEDFAGPLDLRMLWGRLHVKGPWLEEFVFLQIRFEGDSLKVGRHVEGDATLPQRLLELFLFVFDFKTWSDTRWAAVGRICRCLNVALLVGLRQLVAFVLACPGESNYYLGGFANFTGPIAVMSGICALSAPVSDVPLKKLLGDDRLPRLLGDIDGVIEKERDAVSSLELPLFEQLGKACSASGDQLADSVLFATQVQIGYGEYRLRLVRRLPWTLLHGDLEENLRALSAGPCPDDETAMKIWILLRAGTPIAALKVVLELMGELPFTTRLVEQGHVLSSQLLRYHKQYTSSTMAVRTSLAAVKQLVTPVVDPLLKRVARSRRKLQALRKKQPCKIGAQQIYCGGLWRSTRAKVSKQQYVCETRQRVVNSHGKMWKNKTRSQQHVFVVAARERRLLRAFEKRADIRKEVAELSVAVNAHRELMKKGRSLRIADCKWSEATQARYQSLYEEGAWGESHVQALRDQVAIPIKGPPEARLELLQSMDLHESSSAPAPRPAWLSWVCEHRCFFRGSLWKVKGTGLDKYFRFVFCMQQPSLIALLSVEKAKVKATAIVGKSKPVGGLHGSKHHFRATWQWRFSDDHIFDPPCQVEVLRGVSSLVGGVMVSSDDWRPLSSFEEELPAKVDTIGKAKVTKVEEEAECGNFVPEPWMKHPAMWEFLKAEAEVFTKKRLHAKTSAAKASGEVGVAKMPGEEAVIKLVEKRVELGVDSDEANLFFVWQLRGGKWTGEHKGIAFDCYSASIRRGTLAAEYILVYSNLKASASFSIALYGDETALVLARAWIHRHWHFFQLWRAAGGAAIKHFSEAEVKSYSEPEEFQALARDAKGPLLARIAQLRCLVPH